MKKILRNRIVKFLLIKLDILIAFGVTMLFVYLIFLFSCFKSNILIIKDGYNPIYTSEGFGSSTIIKYKNSCYAVTANHVITGNYDDIQKDKDIFFVETTYISEEKDIHIVKLNKCKEYVEYKRPENLKVGQDVHYWCMPAASPIKYYKGYISEIKDNEITIFGYSWMGCSGAGVFTKHNELIGVVSSLMVTPNASYNDIVIHENIMNIPIVKEEYFIGK